MLQEKRFLILFLNFFYFFLELNKYLLDYPFKYGERRVSKLNRKKSRQNVNLLQQLKKKKNYKTNFKLKQS